MRSARRRDSGDVPKAEAVTAALSGDAQSAGNMLCEDCCNRDCGSGGVGDGGRDEKRLRRYRNTTPISRSRSQYSVSWSSSWEDICSSVVSCGCSGMPQSDVSASTAGDTGGFAKVGAKRGGAMLESGASTEGIVGLDGGIWRGCVCVVGWST